MGISLLESSRVLDIAAFSILYTCTIVNNAKELFYLLIMITMSSFSLIN